MWNLSTSHITAGFNFIVAITFVFCLLVKIFYLQKKKPSDGLVFLISPDDFVFIHIYYKCKRNTNSEQITNRFAQKKSLSKNN